MALKTILITGCSAGGIGGALALALAKQGHHIFATARNPSKIAAEVSALSNVTILTLDVTSAASVQSAAKAVASSGRGLDVLVNNAGVGYVTPILDMDIEKVQQLYETNVWGCVRTIQAFQDLLIASRGRIVNVGTVASFLNMPWLSPYSSSKAALTNLSECLRLELSPFNVSVVTIIGGVIVSNWDVNNANFSLPGGSHYTFIEDKIRGWATGESKPKGGSTVDEFALSCMRDIVGDKKGGLVWRGANAGAVWMVKTFFPTWVVDMVVSENHGLKELSGAGGVM